MMTAVLAASPSRLAPPPSTPFMPGSASNRAVRAQRKNRSHRQPVSGSPRLVDLAGRSVALSPNVPAVFDAPLAEHHRVIGRWAAAREGTAQRYSRIEAKRRIETLFETAVLDILRPVEFVDLRVVVLHGEGGEPPALAIFCDDVGQIDLGWIEKANVLANTLNGPVAPMRWQATAYDVLCITLPAALPIFGFDELMEEMSGYYWDGCIDDEAARRSLIEYHGYDESSVDEIVLPSAMKARRPEWMLRKNGTALKHLPPGLAGRLRKCLEAHKALVRINTVGSAWHFDTDLIHYYLPDFEDRSTSLPLTLVPFDQFGAELDAICQTGMEMGFMDIVGLCPLPSAEHIDDWFASLRLGADVLIAAQAITAIDPYSC